MAKTKRSKVKREELAGQADPRAPLDARAFLAASQPVLARLEADLVARAKASPAVTRALEARWEAEKKASRTAEPFAGWTAALATQVAAAWLLSCVFVRTLEDRGLLKQGRIAGPGAEDSQRQFFQLAPSLTERDYLLAVFRELAHHPAAAGLFDPEHSLVWKLSPSAVAAQDLLALFRAPSVGEPAFRFGQSKTGFLGDLYQELSEEARKRYALLQTPPFIEEFILDRTLEPAIRRFTLDDTTVIDPTCGSGHFLLGAFDRLFEHRLRTEPGVDERISAVKALDCVYGADINPYAVAIARFRLTLSFLEKAGYKKLAQAPKLPLHVVVADSLRINPQHPQQELWQAAGEGSASRWLGDVFSIDDEREAKEVLGRTYAAVVGNPPYITVKDPALREVYRAMYRAAAGKYALSAPFCERFFQLARPRGYTGQITSNSFMKREFGKPLIEEFIPTINLEFIVNTEGAHIPGHNTPTVLLFGTNDKQRAEDVLAVLAKRGEPSEPKNAATGYVWSSIAEHSAEVGFENDYIKVERLDHGELVQHPWCIGEGRELKKLLEQRAPQRLRDFVADVGPACFTGIDEVFIFSRNVRRTLRLEEPIIRVMAMGEAIRDWGITTDELALVPYDLETNSLLDLDLHSNWARYLWPYRCFAQQGLSFGGRTKEEEGRKWWEWYRWIPERLNRSMRIVFAFVATHNHFVLDRGGTVFSRTSPTITLREVSTESDHLTLLGYLNSSTACLWMKQVLFVKATGTNVGEMRGLPERLHYEFAGTALQDLPVPVLPDRIGRLAASVHDLATKRQGLSPRNVLETAQEHGLSLHVRLKMAAEEHDALLRRMVVLQEEIDWEIYVAFGLVDASVLASSHGIHLDGLECTPSSRPFADQSEVSAALETLWKKRREAIASSPLLELVERPLFKRPWLGPQGVFHRDGWSYEALASVAVFEEIVNRIEIALSSSSNTLSLRAICEKVAADISALLQLRPSAVQERSVESIIAEALDRDAVPFLAQLTYADSGLEKRAQWSRVWEGQRAQDSGKQTLLDSAGKYTAKDFRDPNFYRLRGPLDVAKERFVSYPGCESHNDNEPVYGWAGWDCLQRALALGALYLERKREGWTRTQLTPMLAGLLDLIPWVEQWHAEPSEHFGGQRPGSYFGLFLEGECSEHGLTRDVLRTWRPDKRAGGKATPRRSERDDGAEAADRRTDAEESDDAGAELAAEKPDKPKKPRTRKKRAAAATGAAPAEAPVVEEGE